MKPFPLLVSLLALIYSCIEAELTTSDIQLSWLTNTSMEVKFIGNTTDILLLTPTSNIPGMDTPCLFAGKLQGDPGSVVAVSGCMESNETSVSISSMLLPGGLMDVLLVDGVTYDIKDGSETSFIGIEDDVLYTSSRKKRQVHEGTDDDFLIPPPNPTPIAAAFFGPLPERVFIKTDIKYDNSLLGHFGGSHSKTKQWLSRVVELAKPRMAHRSLTMPITLQVDQMDHTNAVLKANGANLRSLRPRKFTSYFCKDILTIGGGIVGIAWLGSACRKDGVAANINEMWTTSNTELRTAKVFAHELGHNLGMEHDFEPKHGGYNGPCNGKGLMSDGNPPDQWSECSNADFTEWWRREGFSCVKADKDNTLIFLGPGTYTSGQSEVFVTSGSENNNPARATCTVPQFPIKDVVRSVGFVHEDILHICGGKSERGVQSACFSLINSTWSKTTPMLKRRSGASAVRMNNGSVLVSGGWGDRWQLQTSELFTGSSWTPAIQLPSERGSHCMLQLSTGELFLHGGAAGCCVVNETYISKDHTTWKKVKGSKNIWSYHACTEVIINSDQQVWVGKGEKTEIFQRVRGSWTWTDGPDLPLYCRSLSSAKFVSYNGKLFYACGTDKNIYQLKDDWKTHTNAWTKIGQMLEKRQWFPALLITEDVCKGGQKRHPYR